MIIMDLKGISWVGNVYQKFEAMCLEVEEIMYQDTVKYVENQVQTVGSTVKKFYSDVMQDLLPPSTVDAAKDGVSDLPLELYADVGIYMKPKVAMKEDHVKIDNIEKLTEDPKMIIDNNAAHSPTFHRLSHVDNLFPLSQWDSPGVAPGQYGKGSLSNKSYMGTKKRCKRENMSLYEKSGAISPLDKDLIRASSFCEPSNENLGDCAEEAAKRYVEGCLSNKSYLGANKSSKREYVPPSEKSGGITPLDKDLTGGSSVHKFSNENHKASSDQKDKITNLGSVEVTGHDSIEESKNKIENASEQMPDIKTDGSSFDMVNLIESGMSKEMDMRPYSQCRALQEATDVCMNDELVSLEESCENGRVQRSEIACEEDFVSNSEMQIIQQVDKAKLEESCIMVNRDELHFTQNGGKSKSYKKKIQDVFSSRKKLTRKNEQLAIWPGGDSYPNQEESIKNSMSGLDINDARRSPTPDFCESEWEII
ncbi:uncharacterized protein LOC110653770 isoform X2 [Hevea brasiliensis]|uniref:uncharacterized protein LOC110653770 isoform X2 n=1 Tax=Hevea brasiliensis TaxID=3981 RepID=UPI0025D6B9FA|nr:uncharacterized protein LOC110653770 isoform X2 [Hevea brasiliensis]